MSIELGPRPIPKENPRGGDMAAGHALSGYVIFEGPKMSWHDVLLIAQTGYLPISWYPCDRLIGAVNLIEVCP
jgi:hypothetical protein